MNENLTQKIAQTYFPDTYELLPDGAFESLAKGESVDIVTVDGANQMDIGSALGIGKLLFDVVKFVYQYSRDKTSDMKTANEIKHKLRNKYSELFQDFSENEMNDFIKDIQNG